MYHISESTHLLLDRQASSYQAEDLSELNSKDLMLNFLNSSRSFFYTRVLTSLIKFALMLVVIFLQADHKFSSTFTFAFTGLILEMYYLVTYFILYHYDEDRPTELSIFNSYSIFLTVIWNCYGVYNYWICGSCHDEGEPLHTIISVLLAIGITNLSMPYVVHSLFAICLPVGLLIWFISWTVKSNSRRDEEIKGYLSKNAVEGDLQQDGPCAICRCEYDSSDKVVALSCNKGHRFHMNCIEAWMRAKLSCPICRKSISLRT